MLRRILTALAIVMGGFLILPQTASAHHPVVSGTAHCDDDGSWYIDWVVSPWAHQPSYTWEITSPANVYSPAGAQQANGSSTFTRTQHLDAGVAWVQETVTAKWYDSDGDQVAQGTRSSDKVYKPTGCTPPPCEYNPELPANSPECTPPPCEYDPQLPADDPECQPPPCEYDPQLPADDPECQPPPCSYDPQLPADDPQCQPDPCEYDPELPADDPECQPDPCEYDPELPANSPECTPPPCEYDPQLPADDPECQPGDTTTTTTEPPGDTTTTTVASGGPTTTTASSGPTTTTASGAPTTTAAPQLPRTGADGVSRMAAIGAVLVLAGAGIAMAARRRPVT